MDEFEEELLILMYGSKLVEIEEDEEIRGELGPDNVSGGEQEREEESSEYPKYNSWKKLKEQNFNYTKFKSRSTLFQLDLGVY